MTQPFNNNSSQKERAQFVRDSYHTRANADASLEQSGRFAKPQAITGKDPATLYPKLPTSSPWSNPIEAVEPPLGFSVEETPIVGEQWEIEKSLDENFAVQRAIRDGAPPSPGGLTPAALEQAPGGEVVRSGQAEEPALREPLTPSGRHSITQRRVSPSNSIKRRLR